MFDARTLATPSAMFDIFRVIRFSHFSAALLLSVGLIAFSGCQWLSPKPRPAPPPPIPPEMLLPNMGKPDQYEAFRPIMPEQFSSPIVVQEPPKIEPKPDTATQEKIEELNRRISDLETQLEEARQTPPVNLIDPPSLDNAPEVEKQEVRSMRSLPIINKQGVNVYADDSQLVHIEVADKTLFMSNNWQLTAEGEETLRTIAAEIKAFDSKSILDIEGHTDNLMGDPNNPMLKHDISSEKTKVVMDFFVNSLRWDASRIGTSSFGRSRPIVDNGTPEGRARNNRIEIVIRDRNE